MEGTVEINGELRLFVHDITLFLQDHSNHVAEKIEPMFQRAYRLYVKYDVERQTAAQSRNTGCSMTFNHRSKARSPVLR